MERFMKFSDDASLQAAAAITAARVAQSRVALDDVAIGKLLRDTFDLVRAVEGLLDKELSMRRDPKLSALKKAIDD
jgi:hypothetical protein